MKFTTLEVKGVREVDGDNVEVVEYDDEADFFSIYGRDEQGFAHCIGDFRSREGAEQIKSALET